MIFMTNPLHLNRTKSNQFPHMFSSFPLDPLDFFCQKNVFSILILCFPFKVIKMKKFRKIAAVLLCVVMIAASLQCLAFAAPQDSGKLNFLVLGDSIAEGFGVENKEDAAYGKIVADTNGYNYRNLAQVANDTQDLIRKIETVDEFRESIAWADVINI